MTVPFRVGDACARDELLRHQLWEALARLRPDAAPRWGRMTAQQMVEHLASVFEVSAGRAPGECSVPEERRARFKAFLRDDTPMPREFRNPLLTGGLPPLRHASLEDAIRALRTEVERFLELPRDAACPTGTHPVFGPLTAEEWSRSHFKHVFHHLDQFGLMDTGRASE